MTSVARSYFHRGSDKPLLGITIPECFRTIVDKFPNREALVSIPQKRRLTYTELFEKVTTLALALIAIGFQKNDRIGIWSTNNTEWILLQIATAMIGAILVNINPAYRSKELKFALKQSQLHGIFTIPSFKSSDYLAMLVELLPEIETQPSDNLKSSEFPSLRRVVLYDPNNVEETVRTHSGITLWSELICASKQIKRSTLDEITLSLDRDDPINIQYTSGTTGFPKAVVLTHHNILNNAYFAAKAMGFSEHDRLCIPLPFYHCFGMVLSNLLCLSTGACAVIPSEHFGALESLQTVQTERCTAIHGVPTMFIAQLEHPRFNEFDLTCLRTGIMAGAPCPPVLMKRVIEDMHCPEILIGYGETEASPLTHLTLRADSLDKRTRTVGKNLPHQEVKIIDVSSGQTVALRQIGEVCFRGYHVMHGYYRNDQATNKAIDANGWLHSGDLGAMDSEGYLKITGRLKDMIIRGGENIYPREIEDLIFTHPKVAEVAVFGIPDDYYGEAVVAWIQLHAGETATAEEIQEFCKNNIAHFKIPQYIQFVSEYPMTVTGKLQKYRMREITCEEKGIAI